MLSAFEIPSGEAFGVSALKSTLILIVDIPSDEFFYDPEIWEEGIWSEESFGVGNIYAHLVLVDGIPSAEFVESGILYENILSLDPNGSIPSQEAFGTPWLIKHTDKAFITFSAKARQYKYIVKK